VWATSPSRDSPSARARRHNEPCALPLVESYLDAPQPRGPEYFAGVRSLSAPVTPSMRSVTTRRHRQTGCRSGPRGHRRLHPRRRDREPDGLDGTFGLLPSRSRRAGHLTASTWPTRSALPVAPRASHHCRSRMGGCGCPPERSRSRSTLLAATGRARSPWLQRLLTGRGKLDALPRI